MTQPLLQIDNLESFYGPIMAIRGVSLRVQEGQLVTVLGANGAGKTTLLKTISGVMDPEKGTVQLNGEAIEGIEADAVVRRGMVHVPEGREIFPLMTVAENIAMGAYTRTDRGGISADEELVYKLVAKYISTLDDLKAKAPYGNTVNFDNPMLGMCGANPVQYHPGAARAWREAGYQLDDCAVAK